MNKEEALKKIAEEDGFFKHNNYEIVEASENACIIKAKITKNSLNLYGIAHGGFIFGLGDTVLGMAASATGRPAVTLNSTINYLRPAKSEYIIAKAELIKAGKTTSYLQAKIYDDQDKLIASMDANYYYIG